jgi:thiazole synthase ThiGH ThiG subunit
MKTITRSYLLLILFLGSFVLLPSCKSSTYGSKVKEPFSSSAYESNKKYFRAVGKGQSQKDNIAKGKADIEAKRVMAGQVNTSIQSMVDQYLGQTDNADAADIADKFQSLTREVMETEMMDLRLIGEEKYYNGEEYTVFIAYEIKKKDMFKFMKKMAKANERMNEAERKAIEEILEEEIQKLEADE